MIGLFVAVLIAGMWILGVVLGPQRRTPIKQQPFECGMTPFQNPGEQFGLKFYLIAKDGRHAGVSLWGPADFAVTDSKGTRLEKCTCLYERTMA